MLVNTYKVTVKHDKGKIDIIVKATCKKSAIKMIMDNEGCPINAIIKVVKK
jgi:hypothetical protein